MHCTGVKRGGEGGARASNFGTRTAVFSVQKKKIRKIRFPGRSLPIFLQFFGVPEKLCEKIALFSLMHCTRGKTIFFKKKAPLECPIFDFFHFFSLFFNFFHIFLNFFQIFGFPEGVPGGNCPGSGGGGGVF